MMDYKKIGFKAGIEVHQQVEGRKLFCHCPSLVNDSNEISYKFERKLRAVAGEEGRKDVAAEYEQSKKKTYVYEACKTSSCNVEFDEEPPHEISEFALDTTLIVAQMFNCKLVDEVQVMRKAVIDGSNVSGFQRTMLVGYGGYLDTSKGKVGIDGVFLEEEAAKKIETTKDKVVYRLDRLGVPLLEIATKPDIKDAEHAKEVAGIIGMILRSTGRVKRGIGSIRQDINMSIKGGNRVELKGFQDLQSIPKVIGIEVKRHLKESVGKEVRKVESDFTTTFLRPIPGRSRMYPETDVAPVKIDSARLKMLEIPELITERAANFEKKYGLNAQMAEEIVKDNIPFDYYAEKFKLDAGLIANVLIEMPKEIKSRLGIKGELSKKDFEFVFENLQEQRISKDAVLEILADLAAGKRVSLEEYKKVEVSEAEIKKFVENNKGASFNAVMGEVMKKYRGKVDGKELAKLVGKFYEK